MLVAALGLRKVHEIPGEERVGQGHVGMDAGGRQRVAVQVHAFLEIAALGDGPVAGDGLVADIGQEEQVAVPVMQPLPELNGCPVERVDKRGFLEARFVDRAAGASPIRSSSGTLRAG